MRQMWILAVRYYQHLFLIKLKLRAMVLTLNYTSMTR